MNPLKEVLNNTFSQMKFLNGNNVLVIVAHPDDEALGCGGTIAKLVAQGCNVHIAFMTDGESSRGEQDSTLVDKIKRRKVSALQASKILGAQIVYFGEFPDNQMDTVPLLEIAKKVEQVIRNIKPVTIITHHYGDVNIDHKLTYEAVTIASRPQANNNYLKTVLCFETPSSTEWSMSGGRDVFIPNIFVDISDTIDQKIHALNEYSSEMHQSPHPRSVKGVESLACWRGATIGVASAEAYYLGRHIL